VVVRAPVIIAALREYFELLWERATPLKASRSAAPGDRLTPAQRAVLELMAEGLHDDAIAHRAGISTTTVRRTSPPSSTASASGAGSPQVQLPSDGAGSASQRIRRRP
jgi:FixJ family two-component response regulator